MALSFPQTHKKTKSTKANTINGKGHWSGVCSNLCWIAQAPSPAQELTEAVLISPLPRSFDSPVDMQETLTSLSVY